jgi:HSP20 family protein
MCDDPVMRSRIHAVVLPSEAGEFADELRRIFNDLGRAGTAGELTGECSPALDVFETDEAMEISVDLPGVDAEAVRVVIRGNAVLVAGEKSPRRGRGESSFHLVERGFGRFARLIRLSAACDTGKARAVLEDGELRVSVPKRAERRGARFDVPVETSRRPA